MGLVAQSSDLSINWGVNKFAAFTSLKIRFAVPFTVTTTKVQAVIPDYANTCMNRSGVAILRRRTASSA